MRSDRNALARGFELDLEAEVRALRELKRRSDDLGLPSITSGDLRSAAELVLDARRRLRRDLGMDDLDDHGGRR